MTTLAERLRALLRESNLELSFREHYAWYARVIDALREAADALDRWEHPSNWAAFVELLGVGENAENKAVAVAAGAALLKNRCDSQAQTIARLEGERDEALANRCAVYPLDAVAEKELLRLRAELQQLREDHSRLLDTSKTGGSDTCITCAAHVLVITKDLEPEIRRLRTEVERLEYIQREFHNIDDVQEIRSLREALGKAHAAIWAMAEGGWLYHGVEGMTDAQQLVNDYTLAHPKDATPGAAEGVNDRWIRAVTSKRREFYALGTYWSGIPTVNLPPCDFCGRGIVDHDPRTHACPDIAREALNATPGVAEYHRGEVMNPPASAAEGVEAGNLNTPQRHGSGADPRAPEARPADGAPPPLASLPGPGSCHAPEYRLRAAHGQAHSA
jgi:hypothetical protein